MVLHNDISYSKFALISLSLLLSSFYVISFIIKTFEARRFSRKHGCQPAFKIPQAERIIGWSLFRKGLENARNGVILTRNVERHREFGNTWEVSVLGRTFVQTIEPENVKAVLATNFKDFGLGDRIEAFGPLLGAGIFTTDGAQWEHSRALVRPNFTRAQVADLNIFETHINRVIAKIPRDKSVVDLQTLFYSFTFDSSTEFLLGESAGLLISPDGSEQQLFGAAFDYAQKTLRHRTRIGPLVRFHRDKDFKRACKRVHDWVDNYVYRALEYRKSVEAGEKPHDKADNDQYIFLNELAKASNDPIRLRSEVVNILVAGRDTTAGVLSNLFWVLARRPDVWKKLKTEVDELKGAKPTYETIKNMTYLKYVLNEALRLFPGVPGNARFALKNTTIPLGGGPDGRSPIFVPKGSSVAYSTFAMHRRKDIYGEDADEFRPERWKDLRVSWEYLPFNGGPRICVGQQFALAMASYAIIRILQEFEAIEPRDEREWKEGLTLTLSSGTGVQVAMITKA